MKTKEKNKAYQAAYRVAHKEERDAYRAANREKAAATTVSWRAANPEKARASRLKRKYGLTPEAFQLMLSTQKNACAICKESFTKSLHVDHDHVTGEVRGLLCGGCNRALGIFKDSLEILDRAKEYLRGSKPTVR